MSLQIVLPRESTFRTAESLAATIMLAVESSSIMLSLMAN
jgi:hypothetical protein